MATAFFTPLQYGSNQSVPVLGYQFDPQARQQAGLRSIVSFLGTKERTVKHKGWEDNVQ